MLERVNNTFFAVVQANTNPALDKVQTIEAPKLAAHADAIFLNAKLFARVKALYDRRASLKLDAEALQVLTLYYRQFVHAGALLSDQDKTRLKQINKEDASLEAQFQQKLVAAAKAGALVVTNKADLAGLTDAEVADIFCGCLLPHLALRGSELVVNGLRGLTPERRDFWLWYLKELDIHADVSLDAPASERAASPSLPASHRTGLYFGGGVESLALLRLIKHTKPYLMTVDGPSWMNSDYDQSSIKGEIRQTLRRAATVHSGARAVSALSPTPVSPLPPLLVITRLVPVIQDSRGKHVPCGPWMPGTSPTHDGGVC